MRHIDDFTIKEFEQLQQLLNIDKKITKRNAKEIDYISIFQLFGEDFTKLNAIEFSNKWKKISNMTLSNKKISPKYKLNGKRYKVMMNLTKLNAAQFIDLQQIIQNGSKLNELISIYFIPQKRTWLGYKTMKYNDGYDMMKLRDEIYENMTMSVAQSMSDFFLKTSTQLLAVTQIYLKKKLMMTKKKEHNLSITPYLNGFRLPKILRKLRE